MRAIRKSRSLSLSPSFTRTLQEVDAGLPNFSRALELIPSVTWTPLLTEASLTEENIAEAAETDTDHELRNSPQKHSVQHVANVQGAFVMPSSPRLAALAVDVGIAHHRLDALGITGVRDIAFGWEEDEIAAQLGHRGRCLHSRTPFLAEDALQTRVRNEVRGRVDQPPPLPTPAPQSPSNSTSRCV